MKDKTKNSRSNTKKEASYETSKIERELGRVLAPKHQDQNQHLLAMRQVISALHYE